MMHAWPPAICFAIALATSPAAAQGEGRGIGYAATGPVFDLPSGMSVEQLEVHVSFYSVRLAYVFKSASRQMVHFSFALPEMPVDAAEDIATLDGNSDAAGLAADIEPANYLRLAVRVDDRPVALAGRGRALLDGKDVTRTLLDAGVPLLSGSDDEPMWRNPPPEVRAKLEASGLLSLDAAAWTYQADFAWDQSFEPGETRIEVSYAALADYWSDITVDHFPEIAPGGPATRAYCIDDALRRAFFRTPFSYDIYTVTHLFAPSDGWHGPIGRYRLVVDKGAADNLVAFCPLAATKISPTTFEWTTTNFTPEHGIGILLFMNENTAPSGGEE